MEGLQGSLILTGRSIKSFIILLKSAKLVYIIYVRGVERDEKGHNF